MAQFVVEFIAVAKIQVRGSVAVEADTREQAEELARQQAEKDGADKGFQPDVWDDNDVDYSSLEVASIEEQ